MLFVPGNSYMEQPTKFQVYIQKTIKSHLLASQS